MRSRSLSISSAGLKKDNRCGVERSFNLIIRGTINEERGLGLANLHFPGEVIQIASSYGKWKEGHLNVDNWG